MSRVRETFLGSTLRVLATVLLVVAVAVLVAWLLGLIGAPAVEDVRNEFGEVNESATIIQTDLTVENPNPVGVTLGGTTVNYTVYMNDIGMATGQKEGVEIETGRSQLPFTTRMRNNRIPRWWHSHIENGERTKVLVDAQIRSSLLAGRQVSLPQEEAVETDIISQFNSTETRPINANRDFPEDPVLYDNETSARWDRENLSSERTPIDMSFVVYNPKPWPYATTEIGYTITMNGVEVGQGSTEDVVTIPPGETETIRTTTAIDNTNLDEWWVTHLQRNQVTDLEINFYLVVDPVEDDTAGPLDPMTGDQLDEVGEFRVPLETIDYERTIETDIFGTKQNSTDDGSGDDGATDGERTTEPAGTTDTAEQDSGSVTTTLLPTPPSTPEQSTDRTATATPTDDGPPAPGTDDGPLG